MATRRDNTVQKRVMERGLEVTPEQASAFPFTYDDVHLAQLLMQPDGLQNYAELSKQLGISETALKQRLLDPERCAWIAAQMDHAVQSQLGRVHAAVYMAALRTGDHNRAAYLDRLFGRGPKEGPQQVHLHNHNHIDLSGLSTEQLKQFVRDRNRKLRGVLDVEEADNGDEAGPDT
jgi:hypothetical protein